MDSHFLINLPSFIISSFSVYYITSVLTPKQFMSKTIICICSRNLSDVLWYELGNQCSIKLKEQLKKHSKIPEISLKFFCMSEKLYRFAFSDKYWKNHHLLQ